MQIDEQGVKIIPKFMELIEQDIYGLHKDIILEQIMDSYEIFFESVEGISEEERDTITKMTIALWNHTDGRETKHFLNRWFDKLLKTDSRYALALLSELQIKFGKSWVVERMLCSIIEKYCNDSWKDGSIKKFLLTVESAGFDVSQYIVYFRIKKADDTDNKDAKKTIEDFEDNQTHFEAVTPEEAKKWFETHDCETGV